LWQRAWSEHDQTRTCKPSAIGSSGLLVSATTVPVPMNIAPGSITARPVNADSALVRLGCAAAQTGEGRRPLVGPRNDERPLAILPDTAP